MTRSDGGTWWSIGPSSHSTRFCDKCDGLCADAGVNDDAKRRLLTAAAAYMDGAGEAVEKERLSE